ncbi:MAG: hypothetical protein HC838_13440 [Spirulinaceae cyanobacterium RM2_2_10]|nr:hypothetical protein [Spirulinaceae cyanobacterium SM2_1_0]NJO20835.1 hypothetical protein [Spirulinaceae cyanobacterium RM2_2_10]
MNPKFSDLEIALLFVSADVLSANRAVVSRRTEQIFYLSDVCGVEDELPADIDNPAAYLAIPHRQELDLGRTLVEEFVAIHMPEWDAHVHDLFRWPGAYRNFKRLLVSQNRLDQWHQFENMTTALWLQAWCRQNGLDFDLDEPI